MPLSEDDQYAREAARQLKFAKSSISWKVTDAKNAGIHPLYALGAQTHQASPIVVNSRGGSTGGGSFASMGQSMRPRDHKSPEQKQMDALQLQNQRLQNDILRKRLSLMGQDPVQTPSIMNDPLAYTAHYGQKLYGGPKKIVNAIESAYGGNPIRKVYRRIRYNRRRFNAQKYWGDRMWEENAKIKGGLKP